MNLDTGAALHQSPFVVTRSRLVTSRIPRAQIPVLPLQHPPAFPEGLAPVATDAVLRLGHYSCSIVAGTSASLASGCMAAGTWLYGGRMLLSGFLTLLAGDKLWRAINVDRWQRAVNPVGLLADASGHAVMMLYLPLECLRWLVSVAPHLSPPTLAVEGTLVVGALWLMWISCQTGGMLTRLSSDTEENWTVALQPSSAKLMLDATLALNWIAPSLSLLQVGLVGTFSSALGLRQIAEQGLTNEPSLPR